MTKKKIFIIGLVVLILPILGILGTLIIWRRNAFDNPDFWYGYMMYFGTVSLAIVSWLQTIKTEEISNSYIEHQLRQKIGYFTLKENTNQNRAIYIYQKLQMGNYMDYKGEVDCSKNNILGIWVKNIGEDIILNIYPIIGKINGEKVDIPSTINVIYKNEEICFELDNTQYSGSVVKT